MQKKLIIFFLVIAFLIQLTNCTSSNIINPTKNIVKREICDTTAFNYNRNDTSKIVFLGGVVFDTTACALSGYILDRLTLKPIKEGVIYLNDNFVLNAARTDQNGYFKIFNEIVCKADNWWVSISHEKYHCLEFKYSQKYGGVNLRIKLARK